MDFSQEYLNNQVWEDQPLSFGLPMQILEDGREIKAVTYTEPEGHVLFRLYAPGAADVVIRCRYSRGHEIRIPLKAGTDGLFEGILPNREVYGGAQVVRVFMDQQEILSPYLPVCWVGNRPANFIEIPSAAGEDICIQAVPHGAVVREIFWSETLKSFQRCMIYTPPGYMNSEETYPVLYLLHGGTCNELDWIYSGRLPYLLDNLIAGGKIAPLLVVMNNGMVRHEQTQAVWDDALEQMLVRDNIPYIENRYRVSTGKWNRAIAGLSMGAYMTNDIGFRHPELFGYMGQFTACMTHKKDFPNYKRPYHKVMAEAVQNPEAFAGNYKVFFRSTTPEEDYFEYFEADDEICKNAGIDKLPCSYRIVFPENTSKIDSWRMGLRDFVQLIF